jgi:ATP-dependent Clp protease adaptor protein ClpS
MSSKLGSNILRVAVDLEVQRHKLNLKLPDNNAHRTYNIYLLNDNYTMPEFIISVLRRYFYMGSMEAIGLMLQIRQEGRGKCGQYTFEIAEIKVVEINELAKRNQYPLLCIMEENVLVDA